MLMAPTGSEGRTSSLPAASRTLLKVHFGHNNRFGLKTNTEEEEEEAYQWQTDAATTCSQTNLFSANLYL